MGFSADQSITLFSKAAMDGLEADRANVNLEKMALMREQEQAALAYSEATSNMCFVIKNDAGDYEAVEFAKVKDLDGNPFIKAANCDSMGAIKFHVLDENGDISTDEADYERYGTKANPRVVYDDYKNGKLFAWQDKNNSGDLDDVNEIVSMAELAGVVESYYTADDAAAKAEYDAIMARIETKETKLDMTLEDIETEYQATKTQYDSARQLVNQRAQSDFKFFQG